MFPLAHRATVRVALSLPRSLSHFVLLVLLVLLLLLLVNTPITTDSLLRWNQMKCTPVVTRPCLNSSFGVGVGCFRLIQLTWLPLRNTVVRQASRSEPMTDVQLLHVHVAHLHSCVHPNREAGTTRCSAERLCSGGCGACPNSASVHRTYCPGGAYTNATTFVRNPPTSDVPCPSPRQCTARTRTTAADHQRPEPL